MGLRVTGPILLVLVVAACGSDPPTRPDAGTASPPTASGLTAPEQAMRDRIAKLLAERMGENARLIQVRVAGTNVWLSGIAPDRYERHRARDVAHEVPGVTRVDVEELVVR